MATTVYVEYSGDTLVGAIDGANKEFTLSRSARSGSVIAFINRLFVESTDGLKGIYAIATSGKIKATVTYLTAE